MEPQNEHPDLAELHTAIFAQMVSGHGHMIQTFLGRIPNPQTGQTGDPNLDAAELFIAQLEMLQSKTHGNLSPEETQLLTETLAACRMAFVEEVRKLPAEPEPGDASGSKLVITD